MCQVSVFITNRICNSKKVILRLIRWCNLSWPWRIFATSLLWSLVNLFTTRFFLQDRALTRKSNLKFIQVLNRTMSEQQERSLSHVGTIRIRLFPWRCWLVDPLRKYRFIEHHAQSMLYIRSHDRSESEAGATEHRTFVFECSTMLAIFWTWKCSMFECSPIYKCSEVWMFGWTQMFIVRWPLVWGVVQKRPNVW